MSEIVVYQTRPFGAFEWRWPSGNTEKFGCSWIGEVSVNGKSVRFRHALGSRVVYGRRRAHSVTWLAGRPMVEGVEADDYGQSQALLSLLKKSLTGSCFAHTKESRNATATSASWLSVTKSRPLVVRTH